jgi:hypothetical protein
MGLARTATGGCQAVPGMDSQPPQPAISARSGDPGVGGRPYAGFAGSISGLEAVAHPGIGHDIARGIR